MLYQNLSLNVLLESFFVQTVTKLSMNIDLLFFVNSKFLSVVRFSFRTGTRTPARHIIICSSIASLTGIITNYDLSDISRMHDHAKYSCKLSSSLLVTESGKSR